MTNLATQPMQTLYRRLNAVGLDPRYIKGTILPSWWDDEAATSATGLYEAMALISRHTGVELSTLRTNTALKFQNIVCKFKKSDITEESELDLARNLSVQVARLAAGAISGSVQLPESATSVRQAILSHGKPWVGLDSLVEYCWSIGIPVIYISAFPQSVKIMDGLAALVNERPVIIISRRRKHSAWLLFDVAHELGHIACGHIRNNEILIDEQIKEASKDSEELEANRFAIELICGNPDMRIVSNNRWQRSEQLMQQARQVGATRHIDPGHIVLNYAHSMGRSFWAVAMAALKQLEGAGNGPETLKRSMAKNLDWSALPSDDSEFIMRMTQHQESYVA